MSEFEQKMGELLREDSAQVDAGVRGRLAEARFAAVQAARRSARGQGSYQVLRAWIPLGGVAAAVLAVLIWSGDWMKDAGLLSAVQQSAQETLQERSALDDMDLMAAEEHLEMMEDIEFYAWLDSDPALTGEG